MAPDGDEVWAFRSEPFFYLIRSNVRLRNQKTACFCVLLLYPSSPAATATATQPLVRPPARTKATKSTSMHFIGVLMYLVAFTDAACVAINADVAKNGYRSSSFEDDCIVFTPGVSELGKNSFRGITLDTMNVDYSEDALEIGKNTFRPRNQGSELAVNFACEVPSCVAEGQALCTSMNNCSCTTRRLILWVRTHSRQSRWYEYPLVRPCRSRP